MLEVGAKIAAQAFGRADNSRGNLIYCLFGFLSVAFRDACIVNATEQTKSPCSGHATEQAKSRTDIINECDDLVYEKIGE